MTPQALGAGIDRLGGELAEKRRQLQAQLDLCDSEQGAGRTGLDALLASEKLLEEAKSLAAELKGKIDEALRRLGL